MGKLEPKEKVDTSANNKSPGKDDIKRKVINLKSKKINEADIDAIRNKIIDNPNYVDTDLKKAAADLTANYIKGAIAAEYPQYYNAFKDMNYDQLIKQIDKKQAMTDKSLMFYLPDGFNVQPSGDGSITPTSFSISPNSFWANVTNILNEVSVGDNTITTGESFNAYEFFHSQTLASGEAVLRTMGSPLSGIFMLDQNQCVPQNTQMLKGYQASLGVFINAENAQNVGGGTGIGLFTMYTTPINVLKLAVTNPRQFTEMVRIFQATAMNSKKFSLWVICTLNMLQNITNIQVDNYNNNIRNCLNGTLFNAIQKMKNPTNEFNCGLVGTSAVAALTPTSNSLTNASNITLTYDLINNKEFMNAIQYTMKITNGNFQWNANNLTGNPTDTIGATKNTGNNGYQLTNLQPSQYLVSGGELEPRIQAMSANDIYLIVSPEFLVGFKSGVASQLFHWEFQALNNYVKPENIMMLYKTINIPAGYANNGNVSNDNNQTGYPQQVRATLGDRWMPPNCIYMISKPKDENMWTACYGDVWTTDMENSWGMAMASTTFLQYSIWGGVLPWANGMCFYFKNLLNLVSDETQAIMTDFSIGSVAVQETMPSSFNITGNN